MARPQVVVLDVNETLSDLAPLGEAFAAVHLAPELVWAWYAGVLRDGLALTVVGDAADFPDLGRHELRKLLARAGGTGGEEAVEQVMRAFLALPVHPDVPDGLRSLRRAGLRVVTLTNGAPQVAESLLSRAGVREEVEAVLSVHGTGAWKPAAAAYQVAVDACGVPPAALVMTACHPWDIHGGARAGLRTAWVNRAGEPYPAAFTAPDVTVAGLDRLAEALATV
jgi:2-haloacid dehalogenase